MQKPKLLIIDDEKELCLLLKEYFEEEGYLTNCAQNGVDGIEKVKSFGPDVVLLDMRMPGMNGIETLNKIKRMTPASVLCVSAVCDNETVEICLNNGAFGYIFKPIILEDLAQSVESALQTK